MPKRNLSSVFKRSPGLLELYNDGHLDHIIRKFPEIINEKNYLGGSKCSTFLMPGDESVFKVTLRNIGYFKKNNCQKFMNKLQIDENNPIIFFQNHINSLSKYFAPIKDIIYYDDNIFIYTQDCCQSLRTYKRSRSDDSLKPSIIIEILHMIQYMIANDVLVTEIGIANLGILRSKKSHCPQLLIFDYDTIKPLRETMIKYPFRWWGFQLGNLLYYLSFIYQPKKTHWYYNQHHRWGKKNYDFESIRKDFPDCVIELLNCYKDQSNPNIEDKLKKITYQIEVCIRDIRKKF